MRGMHGLILIYIGDYHMTCAHLYGVCGMNLACWLISYMQLYILPDA